MKKKYLWRVREPGIERKARGWYVVVSILALGTAVASFIVGNILFGLLIVVGAFAVMLAGSRSEMVRAYALSEEGVHIDTQIVPWRKVRSFCVKESPLRLIVDTKTLIGVVTIPLVDIDFRAVRTEFKNHNIDEEEGLEPIVEHIARSIGL